ncbi:hypothetical protein HDU79_010095 [Rhizoclosmatium sp. JEL0117]|nr:hypothetical protein HDU79_010095 [Rhizoclosmatium sp. JEL0117]
MPQLPYNKSGWTEDQILDTLIIDVFFPEQDNPSFDGHTCMLGIMVPSINFVMVYGLFRHTAVEVVKSLRTGIEWLESRTAGKVLNIRMDPSGEAESSLMRDACLKLSKTRQITMTDAHNQDGHLNGYFKIMMERVRANIIQTGAPFNFWLNNALVNTFINN